MQYWRYQWVFIFFLTQETKIVVDAKELSGELNLYNWEEYIPPDVLEDFEKEYGVKINIEYFEDEDEIITALQNDPTQYDVIFPSASLLTELLDYNLIAALDHKNIPNIQNLYPDFQNPVYDRGSNYSIAYDWGYTALAYNTKYVEADSWSIFVNSDYKGKVAVLNNMYELVGMGLKTLGYSLNTDEPSEFDAAYSFLVEVFENGAQIEDPVDIEEGLINEDIWIAELYNGEAALLSEEENSDIEVIIPKEGTARFVDVVAIPIGSKNKYTAEVFLNYILRPDVHAKITNYTNYATPNKASMDQGLIDKEILADTAVYPSGEDRQRLESWGDTADSLYTEAWIKLRQFIK